MNLDPDLRPSIRSVPLYIESSWIIIEPDTIHDVLYKPWYIFVDMGE